MRFSSTAALVALPGTLAVSVAEIQGASFGSPYNGKTIANLTGTVSAKGPSGFWIQDSQRSEDVRVSSGLYVFSSNATVRAQVAVGDAVSLGGKIDEFRSTTRPGDLRLTELVSPVDIVVLSSGSVVDPLILGKDRSPPTELLSALDIGSDGFLSSPSNVSLVESVNATLEPALYGLDFWESLEGQLVTIPKPIANNYETSFGEFWVHGDWPTTGKNSRGGLTITRRPDGTVDANPETILIGSPLDGTKNPKTNIGKAFADITGIVTYQFGFYYVLPLTAPVVISTPPTVSLVSTIAKDDDPCSLIFGVYNGENMTPTSKNIPALADEIANVLFGPEIVFLQEVQDDSGVTDNGVVSGNLTLTTLVNAINKASNGTISYSYTEVVPVDGKDGGQPGGNIRVAYLYLPEKVSLVGGSPAGGPLDATEVVVGANGKPTLSFNPGRIEPASEAWLDSRKSLVAAWETVTGSRFFTINVHQTSKGGSSSTQGDARPFVNLGSNQRTLQVNHLAKFSASLLALDSEAAVIIAGDFNEFTQTTPVYKELFAAPMFDIDDTANVPLEERYTYVFDQSNQQLDHIFVSEALKNRGTEVDHIHINTWAASFSARTSDHDPSVGRVNVCTSVTPPPVTNYQLFKGILGGSLAPAITKEGESYYVEGNNFAQLDGAMQRSCNIQHNACANAANGRQVTGLIVNQCDAQTNDCRAANK